MMFSKLLIQWYLQNKRDLPWRNTTNPYLIWLSEIMLQQTRVAQGMPYFFRFTEAFPTVADLANATEEEVLRLWQGLGYYSRARNLHKTAKYIAFECRGEFPKTYDELLKLQGVGDYTAAAIASFSYNENVPVVDGNVYRVLSRFFGIETDIASGSAKNEFKQLASELLPKGKAGLFNQAIMEFGALQCVPKSPNCSDCVLNHGCVALQRKRVAQLPVKSKKIKITQRYFNYLIFLDENGNTKINKRTQKGIWHNLYEFPLLETTAPMSEEGILELIKNQDFVKNPVNEIQLLNSDVTVHKLSHQYLYIRFWKIETAGIIENGKDFEALERLPFPIVIFNFISTLRF